MRTAGERIDYPVINAVLTISRIRATAAPGELKRAVLLPAEQQGRRMRRFVAVLVAGLTVSPALPQTFPLKPIRVVLGYPAGATPDTLMRALGERMAEDFRQPLIIDNRPGAGGIIASETVVRASADGYTALVDGCSAAGMVYALVMAGRPPFDPFKDFTPVGRIMRDHWIVVVSPGLNVSTLDELAVLGKAGKVTLHYPSVGIGSSGHLQSERFRMRVGIPATHVPYKESYIPDLLAGRMSFAVQTTPAVAPLVRSGKLKGLAVLSSARLQALPDVPTTAEVGLPDLIYNAGVCLYAPGGTPRPIVTRLNAALNKASASDVVAKRYADLGVDPVQASPEETAKFIRELMTLVDDLRMRIFGKAR
jgi:tripartite-type tricarboxylate transporter receptor subunit TctC